jgi:hypothetical protein
MSVQSLILGALRVSQYGRAILLVAGPRDDIIAPEARMSIEFLERPTLGHDVQLEVRRSGALVGHIRCDGTGFYQYYRGPLNQLMYEFEDDDLERMKQYVAAKEEWPPLTY